MNHELRVYLFMAINGVKFTLSGWQFNVDLRSSIALLLAPSDMCGNCLNATENFIETETGRVLAGNFGVEAEGRGKRAHNVRSCGNYQN